MIAKARWWLLGMGLMVGVPAVAKAADEPAKQEPTAAALKAEIDALKPDKLAWREIVWKSCLLEGLKQAKAQHKPVLLWVFIDRPADDARC